MKGRVYFAVCLCYIVAFAASIHAQASRTISTVERRIDTMNRQAKEYDWETMAREKKGENAITAESSKRAKQIRAEIEEDLKAIQTTYNTILVTLQSKVEPANDVVLTYASDVKKHAARLRTNLALPKPDDPDEQSVSLPPTARKSLAELCRHVYEFLTNPIFETQTGLNVEHARKAGLSLDRVIDLSDKIGVRAETLKTKRPLAIPLPQQQAALPR